MNQKHAYHSDEPVPVFLYEIKVRSGSKTYVLGKGQLVSVIRKPGLIAETGSALAEHVSGRTLSLIEGRPAPAGRCGSIFSGSVWMRPIQPGSLASAPILPNGVLLASSETYGEADFHDSCLLAEIKPTGQAM